MVSKEEYVKNHMKMSLGVKIVVVLSIISWILGVLLIIDFYPAVIDWIYTIFEHENDAGRYFLEWFALFVIYEFLHFATLFMLAKKVELGEYYESYCEYKKRLNRLNKSEQSNKKANVDDISKN